MFGGGEIGANSCYATRSSFCEKRSKPVFGAFRRLNALMMCARTVLAGKKNQHSLQIR
jgi:hypothetical protein